MTKRNYSFQCAVSDPDNGHMTVLYLGEQDKEQMDSLPMNRLYEYMITEFNWPTIVEVDQLAMFGKNNDVPVYILKENTRLIFLRALVENFFKKHNIHSTSDFVDYKPHITVPSTNTILDETIYLYFPHLVSWEITDA